MAHTRTLVAEDIGAYLDAHERKDLLRFITCGSVDDGKSTLIGRLLYESQLIFEDHLAALEVDSARFGTQGGELDLALLVDGLAAEREQGITIDVAYRFFSTEKRKFIVADTPGHEQYTRNMITGGSTADLAVILVDARHGVLTQTRRHSYLVALLGIRHVVLAINKLDAVGYSEQVAADIETEYRAFASGVGLRDITCVPISALKGDNVVERSPNTPWYTGPALLEHLESVDVTDDLEGGPMRLPVQHVSRPHLDFRGFSGVLVAGAVGVGDAVRVVPSGRTSTVTGILGAAGDVPAAVAGEAVTLSLADEIDISRGDVIAAADVPPQVADQFEAHVVWMDEDAMKPGRNYLIKLGTVWTQGALAAPKYRVDVNTLEHLAAHTLELNDIGVCTLTTSRRVPFDPYRENRDMGGFIVVDRLTGRTVGAGMIDFALRRSQNVHWQALQIDRDARAQLNGHGAAVVWLTGLSGAGKSAIADTVSRRLHADGVRTYVLDGDNIRHGLNHDLGFTEADRIENIRRVAEVANLMADAGLIVLVSFISPFRAERQMARERIGEKLFLEVHVDTPLDVAEARDPKGLYKKARAGELPNFTGIDSPYEPPENPDLLIKAATTDVDTAAEAIIAKLRADGAID